MVSPEKTGLLWPTVLSGLALLVLLGLGTWQMERRAWKEALLARIAERTKADPIILDAAATLFKSGEDLEYAPVRARGRFLNDRTMFYYAPGPTGPGWHAYTPLETPSGAVLIVNRGFVPEAGKEAWRKALSERSGEFEAVGLLRRPATKSWFSPANDPARNFWYWRDLDGMAAQAVKPASRPVFPFFIESLAGNNPETGTSVLPQGGVTRLELPNRHLEYALTWYGLAATLIGVYLAFARGRLKARRQGSLEPRPRRRLQSP